MKPLTPTARPSGPEFDVHLTESVPVPMRNGVRLATEVYRPARDGRPLTDRRPVLLHRTPYSKAETEATSGECQCRYFASRGYVVVNQDRRGCFGSEGDVNFLVPEAEDGADTLAWMQAGVVRRHGGRLRHLVVRLDPDRHGRAEPDPRQGVLRPSLSHFGCTLGPP
jgi:predicted acyl esterase